MLNLISLALGILAWVLPFVTMAMTEQRQQQSKFKVSFISITACATAIYCQLQYQAHLMLIEDVSAWMDTIDVSVFVSMVLLIGTVLLNVFVLLICKARVYKQDT